MTRPIATLRSMRHFDTVAALGILGLADVLMLAIRTHLNVLSVSLLFLILIVGISLFADRWTSVGAAFVAFLLFDVFFIPPFYTLTVARADHILALIVFLGIAAITSQLVYRVRTRAVEALHHGRQMEMLFDLSRELVGDVTTDSMLQTILGRVTQVFNVDRCVVLMPDETGRLVPRVWYRPSTEPPTLEHASLIREVFEQRHPASIGTQANRHAAALYVPIATSSQSLGVIAVISGRGGQQFTLDEQHLLLTFANQAALALERARLTEEAVNAEILARSDEIKSALLSAVSHDLRTPLASIKASVTTLLQEGITRAAADERDMLSTIDEETDHLTRIVSNLLDLTRIEAGVLQPLKEWNEIEELIDETVQRVRSTLAEHPLTTRIPAGLPPLLFDYVEIAQVLTNLLENAAKYSPPGAPIDIAVCQVSDAVEIAVEDRGRGVPASERDRIFDTFYRIDQQPEVAGSGIGLSISRGIVEAHGGTIRAEPRAGGGLTVRFTLPVAARVSPEMSETEEWARRS
jgi:two-component system sensor histidine kinase KdpD